MQYLEGSCSESVVRECEHSLLASLTRPGCPDSSHLDIRVWTHIFMDTCTKQNIHCCQ